MAAGMDGTSIIILNYNTRDFIETCVQSIREHTRDVPHEIIVVDNGSRDGSVQWLKQQKDVRCIFNAENEGFPKGCNQGLAIAKGSELLLLNSDTIVTPRWLLHLRRALYSRAAVGAVSCMTNKCSNLQQELCDYHDIDGLMRFAAAYNRSNPLRWERRLRLVGFCFLFKREVFEKIGMLDEQFSPGNYEDDDYSLRIWQAGYELLLCRDTFIHHFGGGSFVKDASPEVRARKQKAFRELLDRNKARFLAKWHVPAHYAELGLRDIFPGWQGPEVVRCMDLLEARKYQQEAEEKEAAASAAVCAEDVPAACAPLASIIMPCWNSGAYIEESIASALAQTYEPIELVIADDGSDDPQTLAVLEALDDPRIRVLRLPHRGVSAARNAAVRASHGAYILPLDSDDLIEPPYLSEAIAVLARNPSAGIVYAQADFCEGKTGPWHLPPFDIAGMLRENQIYACAVYRRADFDRTDGYDESLSAYEDWDFWLSLLELGLQPVRLNGTYFHYRKRRARNSASQQGFTVDYLCWMYDAVVGRHLPLYQAHARAFIDGLRREREHAVFAREKAEAKLARAWDWRAYADENRWTKLGQQMPWAVLEERYAAAFPGLGGMAHPVRTAIAIILAQAQLGCDDAEILMQLNENPYLRAFAALPDDKIRFPDGFMAYLHAHVTEGMLQEIAALLHGGA